MIDEKLLIEKLEEEKSDWNYDYNVPINKAIEIVKDLASEHNNGWIPCSERLPEISGEYLTYVEYDDDEFVAIDEIDCEGILKEWNCTPNYHVLAWQPPPLAPYKKGE